MPTLRRAALAALLVPALVPVIAAPALVAAQERGSQSALDWSGAVPAGRSIIVRDVNGAITVTRAAGNRASIVATKRWGRGRPEQVRVELQRPGGESGDVLACAFFTAESSCDVDGYRGGRWRSWDDDGPGDVSVDFEVRLPDGVRLVASTVNGKIEIDGATASVDAQTVNGGVVARSLGGPVKAKTVNGGIDVRMGRTLDDDLTFETVNGSVTVAVPDGLDATLRLRTVNGSVSTDFPVAVSGKLDPRRLEGTLGKGGRRLSLEAVNGSVRLKRG